MLTAAQPRAARAGKMDGCKQPTSERSSSQIKCETRRLSHSARVGGAPGPPPGEHPLPTYYTRTPLLTRNNMRTTHTPAAIGPHSFSCAPPFLYKRCPFGHLVMIPTTLGLATHRLPSKKTASRVSLLPVAFLISCGVVSLLFFFLCFQPFTSSLFVD